MQMLLRRAKSICEVANLLDRTSAVVIADYSTQNLGYRTSAGTTLMLLNGEPLISFVLTTVYTRTFFSASTARWIWNDLKNREADAKAITSDFRNPDGMLIDPTARHAIENRLGPRQSRDHP